MRDCRKDRDEFEPVNRCRIIQTELPEWIGSARRFTVNYAGRAERAKLAIAEDPSFASAYLLLAYCDIVSGVRAFPGEGIQALKRASELSTSVSGRERALINAVSLYLTHDYKRALPAVQAVERVYPDNYLGYATLVNMYRRMNHIDLAGEAAARAADAQRNDFIANAVAADMLLPYDLARGALYAKRARELFQFQHFRQPGPEGFFVRMSQFTELWAFTPGRLL